MVIELKDIGYRDKISNFSYKFDKSKVISIIGKSGCGKSLLGYILMDLVKYDSGNILVNEKSEYDKYMFFKNVGYVFQNPLEHFFCKTVKEEIAFGLKQFNYKVEKSYMQVINALKMVGLNETYLDKKINNLSSGEMELVAIASSLVLNPKVLILDEVSVYLDYKYKHKIINLIKMLRDRYNKTVIIMSNDIEFVYEVSDEYILMDEGSFIRSGNIEEIITDSDILFKYGYEVPKSIQFIKLVKNKKNIDLSYTNDIRELVRDVVNNAK